METLLKSFLGMTMKWGTQTVLLTLSKKSTSSYIKKKSVTSLSPIHLSEQKVIVRVDFNAPTKDGAVTDDTRLRAALPTIQYLLDNNAAVILISHYGRPKGRPSPKLSLKPIATHLEKLLGKPVTMAPDCTGPKVKQLASQLKGQDILLLENVRFHSEETTNDPQFSKALASLGTLFVQDAFGTAHRAHASTVGIAQHLPAVAGTLIEKELAFLGNAMTQPKRPFVAIIGGSKVSSKLQVLESLLDTVDTLVIGGGMAYTFLKAQGKEIGKSLYEDSQLEVATAFLSKASTSNTTVIFPIDHVTVPEFNENASITISQTIPSNQLGVDIGPSTVQLIQSHLTEAQTILWNGPLGVFEMPPFSKGTFAIAETLSECNAITIIGGGDSAAAIKSAGLSHKMTHISTGGGASLEFLQGNVLPGIAVLEDA